MNILDFIHNVSSNLYKEGDVIFKQGDNSDGKMYFVFTGEISILKHRRGKQHEIGIMGPGNFFW